MKTEDSRLEEFRQLRNEVRGSRKHLLVGIDIAKINHRAFFGDANGKTLLKTLVFKNNREGFEKLLARTEALKSQNALSQSVFGMEPTSNYHKPLGEYLIRNDQQVVLVAGKAVSKNRELMDGRWDKNDTKDSANVADLISQAKCMYYEYPSDAIRALRNLLSLKRKIKKLEQGLRLRIRNNLVAQHFPEMDICYDSREQDNLSIVKNCVSPAMIAEMEYNDFFKTVVRRQQGLRQHKHLYKIWQLAGDSIGCEASEATLCEGELLVQQLGHTREALKQVEERIENLCRDLPGYEYLMSIPGFGPDVTSKVLGYIGNHRRFDKTSQVLKMAGFDLCASRSGKTSNKAVPVISKHGRPDLRYALCQAALVASFQNDNFTKYFSARLRGREKERGIKLKMRVKLAAKMLVIAWTLMKNQEPFNPAYLKID